MKFAWPCDSRSAALDLRRLTADTEVINQRAGGNRKRSDARNTGAESDSEDSNPNTHGDKKRRHERIGEIYDSQLLPALPPAEDKDRSDRHHGEEVQQQTDVH